VIVPETVKAYSVWLPVPTIAIPFSVVEPPSPSVEEPSEPEPTDQPLGVARR
jgi:hypothetical protein